MEKKNEISILIPQPLDQFPENLQNWIYSFAGYLGILLDRILPDQCRISIEEELSKADDEKIVVVLLTPDFTAESDVIKAIQRIANKDSKRIAESGERIIRIFKVCLLPVAPELQPNFLRNYADYQICETGVKPEEVSFDTGIQSPIWSVLVDLAYDISYSVTELANLKRGKSKDHIGPTLFLAETHPEQKANRDALKRELIQFGYNVIPDLHLSGDAAEIEKIVNDLLKDASLAIHIVGNKYGDPLAGSKYSLVELQLQLSSAFGNSSKSKEEFQRIIWFPPDLDPSDIQQQMFIEKLIKREETMRVVEIIQTPLELLKSIVRRRVLKKEKASETKGEIILPDKPFVYLIHEMKHEKEIEPVISWFRDRDIALIWTGMAVSTENIVSLHHHYLANCAGVLIHYPGNNLPWINSKMKDLLKAPGFGRTEPIKAMAVMVQNGDEFKPAISNLDIIPLEKGTTEVNFDNFLEKINQ